MKPNKLKRLGLLLRNELRPFILERDGDDFYGNFGGACGFMSYAMHLLLKELGVESEIAIAGGDFIGCSHCWVETNGLIVDLTATQFGYKKPVQVVKRPSEWHTPRKYTGTKALAELKTWNGYQNPFRGVKTIREAVKRVKEAA